MPFQPINFANIAPQGNPFFRDLVDSLSSGYQAGQMPSQMGRQREKEEISNAMQKFLLQEEPEKFKAFIEGKGIENAMQQLLLNQQPEKFRSSLMNDESSRAYHNAGTNRLNQLTPLEAEHQRLINELYPALTGSQIESSRALANYREGGGASGANNGLTASTRTANQGIIQAIDNTLPLIDELKTLDVPSQLPTKYLSRTEQPKYEAQVAAITDSLVSAMKLPKTNESIKLVEKMVGRNPLESQKDYRKRLEYLVSDLKRRRKGALGLLKGKGFSGDSPTDEYEESNESDMDDISMPALPAPRGGKATLIYNPRTGKLESM